MKFERKVEGYFELLLLEKKIKPLYLRYLNSSYVEMVRVILIG